MSARDACPLDGSLLVTFHGSYPEPRPDLVVRYCPRCDAAFVEMGGSLRCWLRDGHRLALRDEDRPAWDAQPQAVRADRELRVEMAVNLFLRERHAEREAQHCPMDGCRIPTVSRWQAEAGKGWRLTWCGFCSVGFLSASDPDYGWEDVAHLAWRGSRWRVIKLNPTGGTHLVDERVLETLPSPERP